MDPFPRDRRIRPVVSAASEKSAYNPIASMQRLEAAGFKRAQAEALADELRAATDSLVTREILKAELDRLFIRLCAAGAAMLALGVTISKLFV